MQDHYATLGVKRTASAAEIKSAYRKLARKYHPDVSKEPQAEKRFKEVAEAHEALSDVERRAAYDEEQSRPKRSAAQPSWSRGFGTGGAGAAADAGDLYETLFGRGSRARRNVATPGEDQHAQVLIEIEDAYRGAEPTVTLEVPATDALGRVSVQQRRLEVRIPKGVRAGQQLRLAGQGGAGSHGGAAGDLYLEIAFKPHPRFRAEGADVSMDLPLAPWEAALGASVSATTPDGTVQLTIPPGSVPGRKLRLKGKGLPGTPPGDLYAVLTVVLPPSDSTASQAAYAAMAAAFDGFDARASGA